MSRRVPNLWLAGLLCAWLAAVLIVAWLVFLGREVAVERGERATAAFAAVVEQQAARTFQALYLTLGATADAYQLQQPRKNDPAFREMMRRRLRDLPFVRALFVIGPDGWIIHDTDYPKTPNVSLADRPYFRAYRAEPVRSETVWPPILSRSGTGWFLPVTHALGRGEPFEGVVVAALQAAYFEEQFRSIGLTDGYLITLFHGDGTLVASYPARAADIGRNFASLPMFERLADARSGSFWTAQGLVPGKLMVSYRVVEGAPFVVRISRGEEDILAEWRGMALAALLAMAALTVFLGWFLVRMARESARRARERERRVQAEKLEALGQLSGGMAHDLGNLLQLVGLNVELLRARPQDRGTTEHALATMQRAVASGRQVVDRLLAFARRRSLTLARVRLDAWLKAARPLLEQAAGGGMKLEVRIDEPLPEILCDTGELDAALVNLAVNARDATEGRGRLTVHAFVCQGPEHTPKPPAGKAAFVCLTIRDDGPGMTEAVRRRALDPFYTTKGEAGTGLGLSQVYGFMHELGGDLRIDSAPGRGTAVHLFFPIAT